MSTLMTKGDTAISVVPRKQKKNKQAKVVAGYQDALQAMEVYDAQIKEAAALRINNSVNVDESLERYSETKIVIGSLGVGVIGVAGVCTNLIEPIGGVVALVSTFVGLLIPLCEIHTASMGARLSPRMKKTLDEKHASEQLLVNMKEIQFKETEEKILAKAKTAIESINENLKYEGRQVTYSNTRGKEGFGIRAITGMTTWEKERLKAEKETLGLQPIAPAELKALTA